MPNFKSEIIRRLDHIQRLAKQKNYAEIEKLLEEGYVQPAVVIMVSNSGSFLICVPKISDERTHERFRTVGRAVVRIAELSGADVEVSQKRNHLSVWVYYKNGGEEWRSVYSDWGKNWSEREVFSSLRSELHHVFLHRRSLVLQSVRVG